MSVLRDFLTKDGHTMNLLPGGSAYQMLSVDERRLARQLAKSATIGINSRVSDGALGWLRWTAGAFSIIAVVLLIAGILLVANSGLVGVPVLILAAMDAVYAVRCGARSVTMTRSLTR